MVQRGPLLVLSSYAATGLAAIFVPQAYLVRTVLFIWALATLPQTMVAVCFSVVMNAVAGPVHRYELMSRRWSILGLTTSATVAVVGWVLEQVDFPINYQIVFLGLSVGGLISYYFSSHISLPAVEPPRLASQGSLRREVEGIWRPGKQGERLRPLCRQALCLPFRNQPFDAPLSALFCA